MAIFLSAGVRVFHRLEPLKMILFLNVLLFGNGVKKNWAIMELSPYVSRVKVDILSSSFIHDF